MYRLNVRVDHIDFELFNTDLCTMSVLSASKTRKLQVESSYDSYDESS